MSLLRDVFEGPVRAISIERIVTVSGKQNIRAAVVVVVADTDALSPSCRLKTCALRRIAEPAATLVVIELRNARRNLPGIQPAAVGKENIVSSIAVVIEDRHTVTG